MSLESHRQKEYLGGLVYLLTIDASNITGDPSDVLRLVDNYGDSGLGVTYQGNTYKPHPYNIGKVTRSQKSNSSGAKVNISDNADFLITRFIDQIGSIEGARVLELKVYGRFLDDGIDPNSLAYVKRLDHVVNYTEDSDARGELIIHTVDPLSKDIKVPSISFSAGIPNSTTSAMNIFPAVDRNINRDRTE